MGVKSESFRVLVVDDEKNLRDSIAAYLGGENIQAYTAPSGEEAIQLLEQRMVDVLVVDLKMPGMSGLDFLSWLKDEGPSVPALMISAHGDISDAVEAMKRGASDYLVKPFDPDELALRLRNIVYASRLASSARATEAVSAPNVKLGISESSDGWIGAGLAMGELRRLIQRVAPTNSTVLVTGESGTGKEVIARLIHSQSHRSSGPFVPINLGGIPESLLESELFGYEKGAFTGAEGRKLGLFELAVGGTLFLDEVGEMPMQLQVKLLRVLQDKRIMRLGGSRQIPIDIRIIAATNRDLELAVKEGHFREDLFYRLAVIRMRLPPLRERREDIPSLTSYFVDRYAKELGKAKPRLSDDALALLSKYRFPGNVRELENAVERALILCDGDELHSRDFSFAGAELSFSDTQRLAHKEPLTESPKVLSKGALAGQSLRELERQAIQEALERHGGKRNRTAEELGITRRTLLNKIKEYGLEET